jgi:hypothetical protein
MMQARTIKYSQRLGDVLRCLPACKYLADQGHEVFFDCFAQYHGVFEMVSYVKAGHRQGLVIDLEIWPNRYDEFIKSKKTWHDFVYYHHSIKDADKTNIVLDRLGSEPASGLEKGYNLIAPFGISQSYKRNPVAIIQDAVKELGKDNMVILCPPEIKIDGLRTYTAPTITDMAKAIRDAEEFWAVNSSPIILASAVRRGKTSRLFGEKNEHKVQNVFEFEGLVSMD